MKVKIFLLFIFFVFVNCRKSVDNKNSGQWVDISKQLHYSENNNSFVLKSGKFTYQFDEKNLPLKKIILLSSSLAGYFTELEAEGKIVGISSPEYIYSDKLRNLIRDNKIQNVGNEQKYDVEKIISIKPDAVFTNYIKTFDNTYELLEKNGIHVIFMDEYLEQKPLQKAAYIKIFGKLLGLESKADQKFNTIKKKYYNIIKICEQADNKPIVLANEMYGNQWFLPGGKTYIANFIEDAGATYVLNGNKDEISVPKSFEEVFSVSQNAEYWINAGNHKTKRELLSINPNYQKMNVYKHGKIYTITGSEKAKSNDFFEKGNVRPDLVLQDYAKIFHPELFKNHQLIFMQELK